jgi:cytochrome P450
LGYLVALGRNPAQFGGMDQSTYDEHMRLILVELVGGSVETVNLALANVIDYALDRPEVLRALRQASCAEGTAEFDAVIRETMRFAPASPLLFRVAKKDTVLGKSPISKGTLVCLLVQAAMFDPRVFSNPLGFDKGRPSHNYLHFGEAQTLPTDSPALHHCLGKDIAVAELRELVRRIVALQNLRRAAGRKGQKREGLLMVTSLTLRFDPTVAAEQTRTSLPLC